MTSVDVGQHKTLGLTHGHPEKKIETQRKWMLFTPEYASAFDILTSITGHKREMSCHRRISA